MEERPSDRVIDQRLRNRIMEAIKLLAEGDDGVRCIGTGEYFNIFYDWVPHHNDGEMHQNSAITADERISLMEVSTIVDDACDSTPGLMTDDYFIATGWPKRIQPVAQKALDLMRERGRFSEELEEDTPSA